jgi:biotin carboxylase/MFS family permease
VGRQAYRDVVAIRDARALIGASAASQIGDWLYNAALLGYVYAATGSASWVGAATIARLLPYVLLGPVGGAVADRFPRRSVLIVGDVLRLGLMLGLAAVVASNGPVELVIAITALASAAGTAERPAALALLPRLVGETRLGSANALLHSAQDLGVVVGPAIGAVLLAVGPRWLAFLANAATFAASATLVSSIRDRSRPQRVRGNAVSQVREGWHAARTTRFVVPLFLVVATAEFLYGAQTVQLVVYAKRSLGLGVGGYGVLLTALGVGGVVSAFLNARLATTRRVQIAVGATALTVGAAQLVYAGTDVLAVALAVTVIGGTALVSCEVVAETTLARVVPAETLGRVVGVFDAGWVGAMVAGAVLAPVVLGTTTLSTSFIILGGGSMAVVVLALFLLRGLDAASRQHTDEFASRVAVIEALQIAAGVPRLIVERLASGSILCPLPPGVDVVAQGAPAHALFAVVDGSVVVHRNGVPVGRLGPGEPFGERGLLDNAPRNASVTTASDCTLLRIDGEALIEALQAAPAMRPSLDVVHAPVHDDASSAVANSAAGLDSPVDVLGATVVVVGAGYPSKRRIYERLAELGACVVIVDEPEHWSERLAKEGVVAQWISAPITGAADVDAQAVIDAMSAADVRPDGVLTFWENSVPVAARVAAALSLSGNPVDAVDATRSKLRTREISNRLRLATPRALRVRSLDELYAAAADIGFPAVIKPEFGAAAIGCLRIDSFTAIPNVYRLVRGVVTVETDGIFRAGNDLLLEEYLDGVEFDVDLVLEDGSCVFSSVSQNWPTAEPSLQETGLHCPPDHRRRVVRSLTEFCIRTAQAFGFHTGVLHIEAKSTSRGPRIVEINARMGGGPIHLIVEAVWGVDLIEAQLRSSLGLSQTLRRSRRPRCTAVNFIVYAPASGQLVALPLVDGFDSGEQILSLEPHVEIGEDVAGPEVVFATALAEVVVISRDLAGARAAAAELVREPPRVESIRTLAAT